MRKLRVIFGAAALLGGVGLAIAGQSGRAATPVIGPAYDPASPLGCETPITTCDGGETACTYVNSEEQVIRLQWQDVEGACSYPAFYNPQ